MENKLFYAALLFMGFGALLGRGFTFLFGCMLFVADFLERCGLLRPLGRQTKTFLASCGGAVADAVSGRKGEFLKSFSRTCLYLFSAVAFIAIARIWPNGLTLFLGVIGAGMLWVPPVALVVYVAGKYGWKMAGLEEKEKKKEVKTS